MSSASRALGAAFALALASGCVAARQTGVVSRARTQAPTRAPAPIAATASPAPASLAASAVPNAAAPGDEGEPLGLGLERDARVLPAGRSVLEIAVRERRYASIGVFGPVDALLGFEVLGPETTAHGPLDEDGRLPLLTSLLPPEGATSIRVLVDVSEPVTVLRADADPGDASQPEPRALRAGAASPRLLIGLPAPVARADGYLLEAPGRYQFARVDVATSLLAALRQTRVRFRRDPIAVGDISQWNGVRPATDLGLPRHISHEGGRDVDLALPAADGEPSIVRAHCTGVLVTPDTYVCAPGSGHGVDALRLAYLLGLLVDGSGAEAARSDAGAAKQEPRIEKIFTDDAYIREIRAAALELRARRWIKEAGFAALAEEGILRASPWHVDHVHVRFTGEPGRTPWRVVPPSQDVENE